MPILHPLAATAALLGPSPSMPVQTKVLPIAQLAEVGMDPFEVSKAFEGQDGISVALDEPVQITLEEEGQSLELETFDRYSIIVPIRFSDGGPGKLFLPTERKGEKRNEKSK